MSDPKGTYPEANAYSYSKLPPPTSFAPAPELNNNKENSNTTPYVLPVYGTQPYAPQAPMYGQPYQEYNNGYQQPVYPVSYPPTVNQPQQSPYPGYVTTSTTVVPQRGYSGLGLGWIFFIIGWFFPIFWLFGSFFICAGNPSLRVAGRANFICFAMLCVILTIVISTN